MPPRGWSSAPTFRSWLLRDASGKLCASGPPWWSWCIWGLQGNPSPSLGSPRFVGSYVPPFRVRGAPTVGAASSSHGWAYGTAAACWFKRDLGQRSRGSATMPLRRAWTAWRCSGLHSTWARWTSCRSTLVWPWSGWTTGTMASTPRSSSSWFGFGSRGGGHGGNHGRPWLGPQVSPGKSRMQADPSVRSSGPWPMTLSTSPPSASFVACPRSSLVESVDRSFVKAATSGHGSARCASTVLAQTSAIVLAGLMADRGRYAVESAGSSRWDPETSSEVAQAARVREFREQYHLLDDADFAFAFRSAEEALLAGGRGLADAWTKARSEQTEELMPLAASTVEAGSSRDRPAPALHLPAPPVPVQKGVTLSQQAFSADSVNRRVEALAKVFEDAGIHRPSVGNLSDAILAEWKLQLTRLAQVKVTKSEPQTVVNAARTWSELVSFMRSRDRTTIEHLDLASFLASGSKGPKRALNSLRWLNKLGHLGWQLDAIVLDPPASRRAAARSQALVVEPPMLTHLERGVKEAFTRQDPRWTAMLGSWIVGVGVLRYRHVQRAQMVRLSRSTLYCHCPKGKQASKRDGFDFSIAVHRWLALGRACGGPSEPVARGPTRFRRPLLQSGGPRVGHL